MNTIVFAVHVSKQYTSDYVFKAEKEPTRAHPRVDPASKIIAGFWESVRRPNTSLTLVLPA